MDEELDKYKDEVVDDLVGEELYDVDHLRIHLKVMMSSRVLLHRMLS